MNEGAVAGSGEPSARGPGKRVRDALYVHVSALRLLSLGHRTRVERAAAVVGDPDGSGRTWNVAKLDPAAVSLLLYEDFDSVAFPRLLASVRIDAAGQVRRMDFSARTNPPILHRKELLLAQDDPRRDVFASLTRAAEARGLFADVHRIGTAKAWEQRLDGAGVSIEDHSIVAKCREEAGPTLSIGTGSRTGGVPDGKDTMVSFETDGDVVRHRTAIVRSRLSAPMQYLSRYGYIGDDATVLDYGCGQGDDLRALRDGGVVAAGWDPHFAPEADRAPADTVNLGFVLNVIEGLEERTATLRAAWSYCRRVMAVAVMIAGHRPTAGLRSYRDGFLTSRGTFQKYYTQDGLRAFIRDTIGVEPFAVAPGIMFVFREAEDEQEFLYRRQVGRLVRSVPFQPPPRTAAHGARPRRAKEPLATRLLPVLEELWRTALHLGREPVSGEIDPAVGSALTTANVSLARALSLCRDTFDADASLSEAARLRREDLLLFHGLGAFSRTRRDATQSDRLRRDIRSFFGSAKAAESEGRSFLFSLGDPNTVRQACEIAVTAGLAHRASTDIFHLHRDRRDALPVVVRGYLGCASMIFGDLEEADLLRIHVGKGRVTLYHLEEFDARMPLVDRISTIDLKRQSIDDRRLEGRDRAILLCRSCYAADAAEAAERRAFEVKLRAILDIPQEQMLVAKSLLEDAVGRASTTTRGTCSGQEQHRPSRGSS